ncbi:MAG TPA: hypothetical protein VHN99_03360 [Deinococcales bacterium]|nr:hypothetical protein [Deinococcales bacterium]
MTYTEIAAQRFLEGLPYRSPVAAIESGARTIQEWCEVLAEARREHAGHLGGFIPTDDYDLTDDYTTS